MTASGWYPVALAGALDPGTSTGTRIDGQEFVVWRDDAGLSHVWEDRCPHRGMRLSFGFVRGNHIACLYHGWQFDGAGQCRLIPAHPDIKVPKTICATRFTSVERLGMIWLQWPDMASAIEPPEEADAVTWVRTLAIEAPIRTLRDRLPVSAEEPLVRLEVEGLPVLAGLQPLAPSECALHLVIAGARSAADRRAVSAWGVELRRAAEATP